MKTPKTFADIKSDFHRDMSKIKHDYSNQTKNIPKGIMIVTYLFLGFLVIVGLFAAFGPSESDEDRYCPDTETAANRAYTVAQLYMKKQLREPESAIIPLEPIRVAWLGHCSFQVIGSVRAKNGFGGYGENLYSAVTRFDVTAKTFSVSEFDMY